MILYYIEVVLEVINEISIWFKFVVENFDQRLTNKFDSKKDLGINYKPTITSRQWRVQVEQA